MPTSASFCIQYNTEKKNVEEVITAMSRIGIAPLQKKEPGADNNSKNNSNLSYISRKAAESGE